MLLWMTIVLLCGAVWHTLHGPVFYGSVSIFLVAYIGTTTIAIYHIWRHGDEIRRLTALYVYSGAFIGVLLWLSFADLLGISIFYALCALPMVVFSRHLWQYSIAGIGILAALCGIPAWLDVLPTIDERPDVFMAFTYPDLIALLSHLVNVVMGSGIQNVERSSSGRSNRLGSFRRRVPDYSCRAHTKNTETFERPEE